MCYDRNQWMFHHHRCRWKQRELVWRVRLLLKRGKLHQPPRTMAKNRSMFNDDENEIGCTLILAPPDFPLTSGIEWKLSYSKSDFYITHRCLRELWMLVKIWIFVKSIQRDRHPSQPIFQHLHLRSAHHLLTDGFDDFFLLWIYFNVYFKCQNHVIGSCFGTWKKEKNN